MSLGDALGWAATAVIWAGFFGGVFLRWRTRRYAWWYMIGNGLAMVGETLNHDRWGLVISTVLFALWAWVWWNSGGGDGTRRRLRELRKRFEGTRRAAPVPA